MVISTSCGTQLSKVDENRQSRTRQKQRVIKRHVDGFSRLEILQKSVEADPSVDDDGGVATAAAERSRIVGLDVTNLPRGMQVAADCGGRRYRARGVCIGGRGSGRTSRRVRFHNPDGLVQTPYLKRNRPLDGLAGDRDGVAVRLETRRFRFELVLACG